MKPRSACILFILLTVTLLGCSNRDAQDEKGSSRFCGGVFDGSGSLESFDGAVVSSRYHRYWASINTYLASGRDSRYAHCLRVYRRHDPDTTAYIRFDSTNVAELGALAPDFDKHMESFDQNPDNPDVDSLILQQAILLDSTQVPIHSFGGRLARVGFMAWRLQDGMPILYLRFANQELTIDPHARSMEA